MPKPRRKEVDLQSWEGPPLTYRSTITLSEVPWDVTKTCWRVSRSVKVAGTPTIIYWRVFETLKEAQAHATELVGFTPQPAPTLGRPS
jgi:hypothetical protein